MGGLCRYCLKRSSKAWPTVLMMLCARPSQHSRMWQAAGTLVMQPPSHTAVPPSHGTPTGLPGGLTSLVDRVLGDVGHVIRHVLGAGRGQLDLPGPPTGIPSRPPQQYREMGQWMWAQGTLGGLWGRMRGSRGRRGGRQGCRSTPIPGLTVSPPDAKEMDGMWWLAMTCGGRRHTRSWGPRFEGRGPGRWTRTTAKSGAGAGMWGWRRLLDRHPLQPGPGSAWTTEAGMWSPQQGWD